ncbi:LysR family transcriptional regulator [Marinobacter sp. OP 3.4]|uniref:LysR family transcriptional regulator n=1 Tax=Marinobacter sp. OP 3.4 TaxID=3076501 RepID=UPI002E1DB6FB
MNMNNLKLDRLRSFVLVAEEGNLTRAARRRHTTPSAVSEHLRQLEETLLVSLFERTRQGMTLTREGELLLPPARKALAGVREMAELAGQLGQARPVSLSLGINAPPEKLGVDRLIRQCASDLPEISLELRTSTSNTIVHQVLHGEMDCGFVYGDWPDRRLSLTPLMDIEVCVVAPTGVPADGFPETAEAIADLPWIWPSDTCPFHGLLKQLLAEGGAGGRRVATSEDEHTALAMVSAGLGYGVVEGELARDWQARGQVTVLERPMFRSRLSFCTLANQHGAGSPVDRLGRLIREQVFAAGLEGVGPGR